MACAPAPTLAARVTHVPGSTVVAYAADPGEANRVRVAAEGDALILTDAGAAALAPAGDCAPVDATTASCPAVGVTALDLAGGDADDELANATAVPARVDGGEGDDLLQSGRAADVLVGGPGRDAVTYVARWSVTVDLSTGTGGNALFGDRDRLVGLENVAGGDQEGTVDGTTGPNDLAGGGGEDYVDGGRGSDRLTGGDGPDVVAARDAAGDEPVSCGPGIDLAIVDRADRVARSGADRCEQVDDGRQTAPRPGRVYVQPQRCAGRGEDVELGLPAMERSVPLRYAVGLLTGYAGRPAPWLAARGCRVRLTATPGRGRRPASVDVSGDAAAVSQTAGRAVTTTLRIQRPPCASGAGTRGADRTRRVRMRAQRGRGRWRAQGRFSIAAAQGTDWTTVEECAGTRTIVHSGRVRVLDRGRGRTVVVRGGRSYLARSAGRRPATSSGARAR
jgi:hypothetical protein